MRKKYYPILILSAIFLASIIYPITASSQTSEWIKSQTINYESNPDMINYVVANDEAGNVIYAGMDQFSEYYSDMFGSLFLKKYSSDGQEMMNIQITGKGVVQHLEVKNGYYFLSGKFKDEIYFPGQPALYTTDNSREYFMAVFDNSGNTVSLLNLSVIFPNISHPSLFTVLQDNVIVLGMSEGTNSQICKIDLNGNVLQTIEQTDVSMITSIDFDPYGNMVVSGGFANTQCYFGGEMFEVGNSDNMYVAKYNSQGDIQWVTFVEDILYNFHHQIKCDHAGNIYFSGDLFTSSYFGPFQSNGPKPQCWYRFT